MRMVSARDILWMPRRRCGCGEIGIRGGLKIHWGFPRCRFESDQPHHFSNDFFTIPIRALSKGVSPTTRFRPFRVKAFR
jgi:hypothetical protein